ncbi:MAG: hypothetical protein K1060chlam2_00081 [Chlamydiae bacterium]|nr:hypothetical protein [Chlamydiota bacterium]
MTAITRTSDNQAKVSSNQEDRVKKETSVVDKIHKVAKNISINEGTVKLIGAQDAISYPNIDSCITVTAILKDGSMVGAHSVATPVSGQLRSDQILAEMRRQIGNKKVESVYLMGNLNGENWTMTNFGLGRNQSNHDLRATGLAVFIANDLQASKAFTLEKYRSHYKVTANKDGTAHVVCTPVESTLEKNGPVEVDPNMVLDSAFISLEEMVGFCDKQ